MLQRKTENLIVKDFLNNDPIADDNYLYSASSNDMTGLAPTVAHDEYEAQSYEELFPYLPPTPLTPEGVPASPASEGIHAEYRTKVSAQKQNDNVK